MIEDGHPTERFGEKYNAETMTKFAEDVYAKLGQISKDTGVSMQQILAAMSRVNATAVRAEGIALNGLPEDAAPPQPPQDLKVYKLPLLPICVAWCKPVNPLKHKNHAGFQFFANLMYNFTPLEESGIITITGTAYSTHATDLVVCATGSDKLYKAGTNRNLQFFTEYSPGNSKKITNTTTGATGLTTAWLAATPKTLATNIAWNAGDGFSMQTWAPKNIVGQGPLPFAVFFIDNWVGNPGWDKETVYVKARSYTRLRRSYSFFVSASTTGNAGETLDAPTVRATPIFWNGNIRVTWTRGTTFKDYFDELDHYDLYRTTANDTAQLTTSAIVYSGKLFSYTDIGYDVTNAPNGPEQDKTYWYWVVCVNKEGNNGTFSAPDSATLAKGGTVTIYDGLEEETKSFFNVKNWTICWYDDGESEGYWLRWRRDLGGGSYGVYSVPIYVRHTTDYGLHGSGYYIQKYTFHALQIGQDYEFSVQATNNLLVPNLGGGWTTQTYTITDSGIPNTPT